MTATIMPKQLVDAWKPEYVAPIVNYLCHEDCAVTGSIFESGGGWVSMVKFKRTAGHYFDLDKPFGPDEIKANMDKITNWEGADFPDDSHQDKNPMKNKQLVQIIKKMQSQRAKL